MYGKIGTRKIIAIFSALLIAFSFSGCSQPGGNNAATQSAADESLNNTENTTTAESSASIESPPAEESNIIITIGNEYVNYITDIKNEFEANSNIKVEIVERETQDTLDTLQLDGAAGKGPDITLIPYDRIGQFALQETIAELNLPDAGRFYENNVKQVTYDGKVYGAPAIVESIVMYYNKDLLPEPPKTFDELENLANDPAYEENGKTVAFLAPWNAPYIVYGLLAAYGGYVFGNNGTDPDDIGLNNSGSVEAVEYAKTWFDRWPTGMLDIKTNGNLVMEYFTTGKTAAIIAGPWDAASIKETGVNYGVAKIPTLPNGSEYKPFGGGKAWVVSNYSTKKEDSLTFIDYLTNESSQQKLYDTKNEVPANIVVHQEIQQGDDELVKAVIEQYALATSTPNLAEMSEYWSITESMLFDAYKGDISVQEALDNGVNTFKETIAQKYK
jgi:arabinogalactan oligomer/maltooligosaccharide transport system substrate-binding protein